MFKKILFMLILFSTITNAATIHGTVYDLGLEIKENTKIEINTIPNQIQIAQDGTYSFEAPKGAYTIKAEFYLDETLFSSIEENITIVDEGTYRLDLILFESLEDETDLLEEDLTIDTNELKDEVSPLWWILVLFIVMIGVVIIALSIKYMQAKRYNHELDEPKKVLDEDLKKVIKIIKEEGNRVTQKDLRKRLGLSEAKVSLMITELEDKGKVKRIKKGRGNIIILV